MLYGPLKELCLQGSRNSHETSIQQIGFQLSLIVQLHVCYLTDLRNGVVHGAFFFPRLSTRDHLFRRTNLSFVVYWAYFPNYLSISRDFFREELLKDPPKSRPHTKYVRDLHPWSKVIVVFWYFQLEFHIFSHTSIISL